MKQSNDRIKEYFKQNWRQYTVEVPFGKYFHHPEHIETIEDITGESMKSFVSKGIREIDIELYLRCYTYEFDEAEKLLSQGADPDVVLSEWESIMETISWMASDYEMDIDVFIIKKEGMATSEDFIFTLIKAAAAEKMYQLLKPYSKKK